MSEEPAIKLNPKEFVLGFDSLSDPSIMVITIPLKALAGSEDGTPLVRGHLEEAKVMALAHIKRIRETMAKGNGLIVPAGVDPIPAQKGKLEMV